MTDVQPNANPAERTRSDVLSALAALGPELEKRPQGGRLRLQQAGLLFQAGDFWQARDHLAPLYAQNALASEDIALFWYLQ
jgi:hypothetical protein